MSWAPAWLVGGDSAGFFAAAMMAGALINALVYYSGSTLDFYASIAPPITAGAIVPIASYGVQAMPWLVALILCVTILRVRRARNELTRLFGSIDRLTAARTEAEETSRIKSQVMAIFSHELRTPLNAVINYAEMLEEELERGQRAKLASDAARIRHAGRALLDMVERMLDFSMLETGQLKLRISQVDVRTLLMKLTDEVRPRAEARNNRLDLEVGDAVGALLTDEARLRQCLHELIDNACKFTRGGHIIVRAHTRRDDRGADALDVRIEDTGCGMTKEQASLVVHHLVQADGSFTRKRDGLGIGLAMARRLVALMEGSIEVESAPGVGTTVSLLIPRTYVGAESNPVRQAS